MDSKQIEIDFSGFHSVLARFSNDGKTAYFGPWTMGAGGSGKWFEIYYHGQSVCTCIDGKVDIYGLAESALDAVSISEKG